MVGLKNRVNVDIVRILEICRDIELMASELYYYFAELFSDTPEISALWKKTALEEENHANQFVMAINLRSQGIVESLNLDTALAENTLKSIDILLNEVKQNKPGIVDALKMAIRLEDKLSEYHMSSVALFQEESHRKLFVAMMKADSGHLDELEKAYKKVIVLNK